jgi:glycosyltransferase involved in cell wall biosynthesis
MSDSSIPALLNVETKVPLRIGIDARVLMHYEIRGFTRYTLELFRAMKEIAGPGIELYSFSPGPLAGPFQEVFEARPVIFSARREILWEQYELPRQLRKHRIDVFHTTANRGLPYRRACKYVLTCHDIIEQMAEYRAGGNWRGHCRMKYADFCSLNSAHRVITVSNYSKQDICRVHRLPADRVRVIYNGVGREFFRVVPLAERRRIADRYGLPPQYFLYLGGFDARKNVMALVEALALLPAGLPPLALIGEQTPDFAPIAAAIRARGLSASVICPGKAPDTDLPAIYQGALAFVYPSLYEGFGLPAAEAMASGVPVLASGVTSLPEVLAGSGVLFDARDPASIAAQMLRIYNDASLRDDLAVRGRARGEYFSWQTCAEQTLDVYCELAGKSVPSAPLEES